MILKLKNHQRTDVDTSLTQCYLNINNLFQSKFQLLIGRRDFTIPKTIRPNVMHYFITEIPKKKQINNIKSFI